MTALQFPRRGASRVAVMRCPFMSAVFVGGNVRFVSPQEGGSVNARNGLPWYGRVSVLDRLPTPCNAQPYGRSRRLIACRLPDCAARNVDH